MRYLLDNLEGDDCIKLLSFFSCPKNIDVEDFLKNKSIRFEKADQSRTYFILDDERDEILAYFSLSFKELSLVGADISKTKINNLDGVSKNAETVRTYLIGQLAKNFSVTNNPLSLSDILQEIYTLINQARDLIGGRTVILECENNTNLINLYEREGFDRLIVESDDALITMYKCIK